jgi:D-serine deaminase-like pyridoxal phosphate-dependent protein
MSDGTKLDALFTPAAVVDLDRMAANLDRMSSYARQHGIGLRPHTKTHKAPEIAAEQVRRGVVGLTVATLREAEVMAPLGVPLLLAHPPVGTPKIERVVALSSRADVTVALDSVEALDGLGAAVGAARETVGVLLEIDLGMHRVGLQSAAAAVALARRAASLKGVTYRGILFYPGHIREAVGRQDAALARLNTDLGAYIAALAAAGLSPEIVSGGSTPAAFASHRVDGMTEMRPGTYVFNDRTTALVGACAWEDCAYSVVATVVSTAVPGQAVVDAGSKSLFREDLRGTDATGFGALLDRPDVIVKSMSEEHGLLDLAGTEWRPRVGERVRIVPNHVCVSVNLQPHIYGVRGDVVEKKWKVAARGWAD